MEFKFAEAIAKKHRALKHCNKLLAEIDKKGESKVILNNTGVTFVVHKGDAMYLKLSTTRAQLIEDIASYEIVKRETTPVEVVPSPEAQPITTTSKKKIETPEERERRLAYHREYSKRWYAKRKAERVQKESEATV